MSVVFVIVGGSANLYRPYGSKDLLRVLMASQHMLQYHRKKARASGSLKYEIDFCTRKPYNERI